MRSIVQLHHEYSDVLRAALYNYIMSTVMSYV
jgi:hypothetical protein